MMILALSLENYWAVEDYHITRDTKLDGMLMIVRCAVVRTGLVTTCIVTTW